MVIPPVSKTGILQGICGFDSHPLRLRFAVVYDLRIRNYKFLYKQIVLWYYIIMNIITIPKKLAGRDDLIVIPKKEYKKLLLSKRIFEFSPTITDKKNLKRARENRVIGKFLTLNELKQKLGFTG